MARPSYNSLKLAGNVGRGTLMYKESQDMGQGGQMPPDVGQSPVVGNPDEMQAPESANERQFEDDFGSLAYQFVQDRAPALMPYMLGFEVVDRNDDGSKAVGIFGYKVDEDFYYVPAFFLNNQVRGVDMVLNKKTNQFVPLTEEWIDFIINKHSVRIGGPADNRVRESMRNPDLSFVRRPQDALGKVAENEPRWSLKDAWGKIKEASAKLLSDPDFQEMIVGVSSGGRIEKKAESKYVKDFMKKAGGPEAMSGFFKTMHEAGFANAALSLYKGAEAFFTDDLVNASIHVDRMKKKAAARPKVVVTDKVAEDDAPAAAVEDNAKDVDDGDKPMTDEENARQIIEHDFTIKDVRSGDDVSKVSDESAIVDYERRFQAPDVPGKYEFLMADGNVRDGIMLNMVYSGRCENDHTMVCFQDDDIGGIVLAESSPVSMMAVDAGDSLSEEGSLKWLYDKAVAISNVEISESGEEPKAYMFINSKGDAIGPFVVKFVSSDGGHDRLFVDSPYDCVIKTSDKSLEPHYGYMDWDLSDKYHDSNGRRKDCHHDCCCSNICSPRSVISVSKDSTEPKFTSAGAILPATWKALEIKIVRDYENWDYAISEQEREKKRQDAVEKYNRAVSKYTFGTPNDVLSEMHENGVERIKLASDGSDFYIAVGKGKNVGPFNYKQASVQLVSRFGFRPRRAFSALSKAASAGSSRMLVKYPQSMVCGKVEKAAQEMLPGVSMPYPVEQIPASDPYSGIPVYSSPYIDVTHGQTYGYPALPIEGGMTHGINYGGEIERQMGGQEIPGDHGEDFEGVLPIDEEAQRLAQDAAEAGQRHVFDQAAIGGLAKVYDTANVVDSYIPDFMDTLDRLGRVLFLFYWKHEDFSKRYGSDDMVQMEDKIRSVFKQLGSLTLQLKEKSVQKD